MAGNEGAATGFARVESDSLVDTVKDRLLAAIVSGELGPGDRIVEAELARRMGISRGPLREAARLLQQWGILEAEARRGFFVRKVSLEEIDHLADYRICLEAHAARRAVRYASDIEIKELWRLYEAVAEAESAAAREPIGALDRALAFHRHIFVMSRNPRLTEAFDALSVQIRQIAAFVSVADDSEDAPQFFTKYLLQLLEAVESGDADTAAGAITRYLTFSRDQVKRVYMERRLAE